MVERLPLVLVDGKKAQLPPGDTLPGDSVTLDRSNDENMTLATNTTTTWMPYHSFEFEVFADGGHRLDLETFWTYDKTSRPIWFRADVGGVSLLAASAFGNAVINKVNIANLFRVLDLTVGLHTVTVEFRADKAGDLASVVGSGIAVQRWTDA